MNLLIELVIDYIAALVIVFVLATIFITGIRQLLGNNILGPEYTPYIYLVFALAGLSASLKNNWLPFRLKRGLFLVGGTILFYTIKIMIN